MRIFGIAVKLLQRRKLRTLHWLPTGGNPFSNSRVVTPAY